MKRAILVLGAESSGTRLLTQILVAGGCAGDHSHHQPFDNGKFDDKPLIVWRRSFPWMTQHFWPNVKLDLVKPLKRHGYDKIEALVTVRHFWSLEKSQVKNKHVRETKDASENIQLAYGEIFRQLSDLELPYRVVTYEAIAGYGHVAIRPLLKTLGLNENAELPAIDEERDKKHYFAELS